MYHGSASLADFYLIYTASELLKDELGFQIQCLSLASMITNAFGYFAYMQYITHWVYDISMLGVCGAITIKLLWIPRYDYDHFSGPVVWNRDLSGYQLHS